jgi:DNA-binding response OmpR family regulator
MKILLVDDDELLRTVLTEFLTQAGYEVVGTADPHEVRALPEAIVPPSLVISDIDLDSEINGFDVSTVAHRLWPAVGVILISGLPVNHTGQALDQRDRYIQKPFSSAHLLRVIESSTNEARRVQRISGHLQTPTESLEQIIDVFRQTIVTLARREGPDLTFRQLGVLLICYLENDAQTVRGLAGKLNVSAPAIIRALDRLVVFNLVRRGKDSPDKRGVCVQRTIAGAAFIHDFNKVAVEAGKVANGISRAGAYAVESV